MSKGLFISVAARPIVGCSVETSPGAHCDGDVIDLAAAAIDDG
jgi:hypothetical protein